MVQWWLNGLVALALSTVLFYNGKHLPSTLLARKSREGYVDNWIDTY
jgi:hypothetical protein